MKFDLIRPCANCPFRYDTPGYLRGDRAEEIGVQLLMGSTFTCHKTNEFDDDTADAIEDDDSQHCAGALLFLEFQDQPNQMMRWMERIGAYDREKLDLKSPVFETLEDFVSHHREGKQNAN